MGSGVEEKRATPTLPLFSLPPLRSPEHPASGTLTPPLHTLASVPFQWEQEPGKPLPCTALALPSSSSLNDVVKCLDLPPRLTSPTTVLEGPYIAGRSILESSSFRLLRKKQGSFDGTLSLGGSRGSSPDRGLLGAMVLSNSNTTNSKKDKGLFGSWRKRSGAGFNYRSKSEAHAHVHGGNFVFSSFSDDGLASCDFDDGGSSASAVQVAKMRRKRSLLRLSRSNSHFWATIYGALKQVIPRRSSKWRKDVP